MRKQILFHKKIVNCLALFFSLMTLTILSHSITLKGPIDASSVKVNGNVVLSSMTANILTVTSSINAVGLTISVPGRILQTKFASRSTYVEASTTSWVAVGNLISTITLTNSDNYVRIALTGNINTEGLHDPCYVTIFRDSINLGSNLGLSMTSKHASPSKSVGITIIDYPGDTSPHTYQAYIRVGVGYRVFFPWRSTGYLLLEEIGK